MNTKDLILDVIAEKCYMGRNELRDDMTLEGDLFLDSLGFMTIVVELEKKLQELLPLAELKISVRSTVGEICTSVQEYLKRISKEARNLPICFPPPMYFSLHVAAALSMILAEGENEDWFYNNFIQASFYNDYDSKAKSHKYCVYPAMEMRPGQMAAGKYIAQTHVDLEVFNMKADSLYENIKLFINQGYYVSCVADVSRIKGTRYEERSFLLHEVMIFGYDDALETLDILDFDNKQAINRIKIASKDLWEAFTSPELLKIFQGNVNNSVILYRRKKADFTFDFGLVRELLRDYLDSYNSSRRYSLLLPCDENSTWGIGTYDKITEYLEHREERLDVRLFHAFYEHKKLMFDRFRYMKQKGLYHAEDELLHGMEENMQGAETVKLMAMKYNIKPQEQTIEQMTLKLDGIKNREICLYERILRGNGEGR